MAEKSRGERSSVLIGHAGHSRPAPERKALVRVHQLTKVAPLYSRDQVLSSPSPLPRGQGLYGWWFREVPASVPISGCATRDDLTLLYLGVSPGSPRSRGYLRRRITSDLDGDAEASSLRLSLGVLLTETTEYPLRRVGSGDRMTFTEAGEDALNAWMAQNAFVSWVEQENPWEVERAILRSLALPLNLHFNPHPFCRDLSRLRSDAKAQARREPICDVT